MLKLENISKIEEENSKSPEENPSTEKKEFPPAKVEIFEMENNKNQSEIERENKLSNDQIIKDDNSKLVHEFEEMIKEDHKLRKFAEGIPKNSFLNLL